MMLNYIPLIPLFSLEISFAPSKLDLRVKVGRRRSNGRQLHSETEREELSAFSLTVSVVCSTDSWRQRSIAFR